MYAPDTLNITFDPAPAAEGLWTFTLSGDYSVTCNAPIPFSESVAPLCDDDLTTVTYSEDGLSIEGLLVFGEAPDSVTLAVSMDDEEIVSDVITPDYEVDEPNGKGCGERRYADVVFSLPTE